MELLVVAMEGLFRGTVDFELEEWRVEERSVWWLQWRGGLEEQLILNWSKGGIGSVVDVGCVCVLMWSTYFG